MARAIMIFGLLGPGLLVFGGEAVRLKALSGQPPEEEAPHGGPICPPPETMLQGRKEGPLRRARRRDWICRRPAQVSGPDSFLVRVVVREPHHYRWQSFLVTVHLSDFYLRTYLGMLDGHPAKGDVLSQDW